MNDLGDVAAALGLLTTLVYGGTELVKRAFDKDRRAVAIILVATVVGGFGGWVLLPQIGLVLGLVTGLGATGLLTAVQKVGTGTTSTETSLKG